jgi:hypothetical protein
MKGIVIGTRRQALLFGVLAAALILFVVRWSARQRPPESPTAPVAASPETDVRPPRAGARRRAPTPAPDEIPLLSARDLEPRRSGQGAAPVRDLFDPREPTKPPPPPPTPAPTLPPMQGPMPPPPPPPTPAPLEPQFKLIGIFGERENPIAAIQYADAVTNVRKGDVVYNRWIIRNIGYESIDVGFVGFPPTETRRLPITP